jgi:hypothetical protein
VLGLAFHSFTHPAKSDLETAIYVAKETNTHRNEERVTKRVVETRNRAASRSRWSES